jgi:hypothetical protein
MKNIKKFSQFNESSIYSYGRQYRRFENVGGFNIDPKNQNVQTLDPGDYIEIKSKPNVWTAKIFMGCSKPQSMQTEDLYNCCTGMIDISIAEGTWSDPEFRLYTYSDKRDFGQLKYAELICDLTIEHGNVDGLDTTKLSSVVDLSQVESMLMNSGGYKNDEGITITTHFKKGYWHKN